jgi:GNAT superfamily N-acetyltransferase
MPERQRITIWLIEDAGQAIGFGRLYRNIGSYDPLKWFAEIGVLSPFRGKGFGTAMYDHIVQFLRAEGAKFLTGRTSDDDAGSKDYFIRRGFVETKRDFESSLDLTTLDTKTLGSFGSHSLDIKTVQVADSENVRRQWHRLFEETRRDIPRDDIPTPFSYEEFHEIFVNDPLFLWNVSSFVFDGGRLVAMTYLYEAEREGTIFQALTAVDREYRCKGIAKAVKAFAIRRALDAGFTTIYTDNDSRNLAMISINERLGFQRLPGMITLRKELGAVK